MIQNIIIENYKSIQKLKLDLGRITVLIGENGCGKSNILEAIAFSSAAINDKLDNEFLTSRGIRVTDPQFMRAAFNKGNVTKEIKISLYGDNEAEYYCSLENDDDLPYSKWINLVQLRLTKALLNYLEKYGIDDFDRLLDDDEEFASASIKKFLADQEQVKSLHLHNFLIYSPENSALRTFAREGQIQPLGINGEGLFKLLKILSALNKEKLYEIKEKLQLVDSVDPIFEIESCSSRTMG